MQETWAGRPIDTQAQWLLPLVRNLDLPSLLNPASFFTKGREHHCHILAGSFTEFLIRHFGGDRYRKFYRNSTALRLRKRFQKDFGMSPKEAERRGREEIREAMRQKRDDALAMASLRRRMRNDLLLNPFLRLARCCHVESRGSPKKYIEIRWDT